jgi:hypothetical protein
LLNCFILWCFFRTVHGSWLFQADCLFQADWPFQAGGCSRLAGWLLRL